MVEQDGERFHHGMQNGMQCKTYELLISGNFPFNIFGQWLTVGNKTWKKTADKGDHSM